jgi:ribosomal protein S18 acetylase RimI-like enzyme
LLDGLRTTAAEVQQLIESDLSTLLLCIHGKEIVGSICLERHADVAHIGMFVVRPDLQGSGIGKQLLTYAESYAHKHWAVRKLVMHVITLRHALIAFYERRGYLRTGVLKSFPVNPEMWQAKLSGLQLEILLKLI